VSENGAEGLKMVQLLCCEPTLVEKLILGEGRDCPLHSLIVMRKLKWLFMNTSEWKGQIFKLGGYAEKY